MELGSAYGSFFFFVLQLTARRVGSILCYTRYWRGISSLQPERKILTESMLAPQPQLLVNSAAPFCLASAALHLIGCLFSRCDVPIFLLLFDEVAERRVVVAL